MSSVILELQRDALDRNVRIPDLLRKALVVARKLNLRELHSWIENELNGYGQTDDVPAYREVYGQVRGWNPYHGWIPVIFKDPTRGELLSRRKCGQSVAELEHLVWEEKDASSLHMPLPHELQRHFSEEFGFETEVTLIVPRVAVIGIIDAVRTIILNWALKLEEDGITGEALSFTPQEKDAAERSPQNITNFYGPVQSPQIQQGSPQAMQISVNANPDLAAVRSFVQALRETIDELVLLPEQKREAEAELHTVESQLESPKPKSPIIREGLESLRRILEGAGGSVAGQLLLELGKLVI